MLPKQDKENLRSVFMQTRSGMVISQILKKNPRNIEKKIRVNNIFSRMTEMFGCKGK